MNKSYWIRFNSGPLYKKVPQDNITMPFKPSFLSYLCTVVKSQHDLWKLWDLLRLWLSNNHPLWSSIFIQHFVVMRLKNKTSHGPSSLMMLWLTPVWWSGWYYSHTQSLLMTCFCMVLWRSWDMVEKMLKLILTLDLEILSLLFFRYFRWFQRYVLPRTSTNYNNCISFCVSLLSDCSTHKQIRLIKITPHLYFGTSSVISTYISFFL